jgi:hypothetical protein
MRAGLFLSLETKTARTLVRAEAEEQTIFAVMAIRLRALFQTTASVRP